jgi:hypothetical protein
MLLLVMKNTLYNTTFNRTIITGETSDENMRSEKRKWVYAALKTGEA